ncbi:DUF317 domain-containing protein [Kitasatospora sp. NPDC057015]|uniref:DUF317 domain-containing protein n=1 Tax=Kitasatospora sp. NPDC057015 TaxID=3346001 RepID=UPI00363B7736
MPTAPTSDTLVRPLHLAGPGRRDFAADLVTHFGWSAPPAAGDDVLLASPDGQALLALRPDPARWEVTVPSPHQRGFRWTAAFDDHAPSEIAAGVLYTLAHGLEHWPQDLLYSAPGRDAALAVLHEGGWASQQRDGHQVLLAPDRLAALTHPLYGDDAPTVLTGAAQRGTWSVTFSPRTPATVLQVAAATLLRPAVRPADEVPTAHRVRMSTEPLPPMPGQRVLVSPRHLAAAESALTLLPPASALWHQYRPGQMESSCGRVRVKRTPGQGLRVSAGPDGPDHRLAWTAAFSNGTPAEVATTWLESLTDSVAADIDLGTGSTFAPGPGMTVGDAIEPLTCAGWITHTDDAVLHLVSPDGHASARITHGLLNPATTSAQALAHTAHWGATLDVTGAPSHRWHASLSSLAPLHLVNALSLAATDPVPAARRSDRIPAQFLGAVRLETAESTLSPAALASRTRSTATPLVSVTRPAAVPQPSGLPAPAAQRTGTAR